MQKQRRIGAERCINEEANCFWEANHMTRKQTINQNNKNKKKWMKETPEWMNEWITDWLTDWWNNQPKAVFHGFRENRALATVSGTFFRQHCQIEARTCGNIDPRLWQPWSHDTYKNTVIPSLHFTSIVYTQICTLPDYYCAVLFHLPTTVATSVIDICWHDDAKADHEVGSLRTKLSFGWYLWVLENARMTSALRCNVYMLSRMKAQSCNLFLRCIRTTCKASAYLCLEI